MNDELESGVELTQQQQVSTDDNIEHARSSDTLEKYEEGTGEIAVATDTIQGIELGTVDDNNCL